MISKGIIQREIKAVWIVLHTGTPVSQHRSCLFYRDEFVPAKNNNKIDWP
jgi:hypothetical protein